MRRITVVGACIAGLLVPAAPASAHTLTLAKAREVAQRAGASLSTIDEPTAVAGNCRRDSRHQLTCAVSAGEMVSRGSTLCTLDVVVRFRSSDSSRTVAKRRNVVCTTPGLADPGVAPAS